MRRHEQGRLRWTRDEPLQRPVFILTSDVDWASDDCIEAFVAFARARGIKPTLFVTHASAAIAKLQANGAVECGIHPNFLAGSTQGADTDNIVANLCAIVPHPVATRSHRYADSSDIAISLVRHGLEVDSNTCQFLQANLKPQYHWSGLIRLPCFWEDDVHWARGFGWDFTPLRKMFLMPGLKIINVHPFMFALNMPDGAFYARHKYMISGLDAHAATSLRHEGAGVATFLTAMIETVYNAGFEFTTITDFIDTIEPGWREL